MFNPHSSSDMAFNSQAMNQTPDLRKRPSSILANDTLVSRENETWNSAATGNRYNSPTHLPLKLAKNLNHSMAASPSASLEHLYLLQHFIQQDLNRQSECEIEVKVDESFPNRPIRPSVKRPRTLNSASSSMLQDLLASSFSKVSNSQTIPKSEFLSYQQSPIGIKPNQEEGKEASLLELFRKLNESHKKAPSSPSAQASSSLTVELLSSALGLSPSRDNFQPYLQIKANDIESRKFEAFHSNSPRSPLCIQQSAIPNQQVYEARNSSPEPSTQVETISRLARTNSALSSTDTSPFSSSVDLSLSLMPNSSEDSASLNMKGYSNVASFPSSPSSKDPIFSPSTEFSTSTASMLASSIQQLNKFMQSKVRLEQSNQVNAEIVPEANDFPRIIESITSLNAESSSSAAPFAAVISQSSFKSGSDNPNPRFDNSYSPKAFSPSLVGGQLTPCCHSLCSLSFSPCVLKSNQPNFTFGSQSSNLRSNAFENLPSAFVLGNDFKFGSGKPITEAQVSLPPTGNSNFQTKPDLMPLKVLTSNSGTPAHVAAAAEMWLKQHLASAKPEPYVGSTQVPDLSLDLNLRL